MQIFASLTNIFANIFNIIFFQIFEFGENKKLSRGEKRKEERRKRAAKGEQGGGTKREGDLIN